MADNFVSTVSSKDFDKGLKGGLSFANLSPASDGSDARKVVRVNSAGTGFELAEQEEQQGGGTSAQSDWNQNDETAKDYVKNRFGGYYEKVYDALLGETELNFSHELVNLEDCDYAYTAYLDESTVMPLWEGGTVRVVFDGVTYEKTYESYGFAPDDSVPFGIFADIIDLGKAFIYTLSDEDSHTVEISKVTTSPVPISEEFLPTAEPVADVTQAPTADDFNALLNSLRNAGYLAAE